jgi:hypothetical protein
LRQRKAIGMIEGDECVAQCWREASGADHWHPDSCWVVATPKFVDRVKAESTEWDGSAAEALGIKGVGRHRDRSRAPLRAESAADGPLSNRMRRRRGSC